MDMNNGFALGLNADSCCDSSHNAWLPLFVAMMAMMGSYAGREKDVEINVRISGSSTPAILGAVAGSMAALESRIKEIEEKMHD